MSILEEQIEALECQLAHLKGCLPQNEVSNKMIRNPSMWYDIDNGVNMKNLG